MSISLLYREVPAETKKAMGEHWMKTGCTLDELGRVFDLSFHIARRAVNDALKERKESLEGNYYEAY